MVPDVVYVGGIGGVGPCSLLRALGDRPAPVVAHLRDYWLLTLLYGGSEFSSLRVPSAEEAAHRNRRSPRPAVNFDDRPGPNPAGPLPRSHFPPDVIEVIPQGPRLSPAERRGGPRIDGELQLLFVGRLDPEKGAHLLLQRLAVVASEASKPTIRCDLAGPPGPEPYMRRLRRLMADDALQGSVRMLGSIQRDNPASLRPVRFCGGAVPVAGALLPGGA